jgi:hypothetical protein
MSARGARVTESDVGDYSSVDEIARLYDGKRWCRRIGQILGVSADRVSTLFKAHPKEPLRRAAAISRGLVPYIGARGIGRRDYVVIRLARKSSSQAATLRLSLKESLPDDRLIRL